MVVDVDVGRVARRGDLGVKGVIVRSSIPKLLQRIRGGLSGCFNGCLLSIG